ncbi:hypothetical protein LXL04_031191 [Taraxacum kok-saghyz]
MEKEDSTEKKTVGSPAPEDAKKVDAPEGEDHNVNTPIKNELSGGEMVGTTNDTDEKKHILQEEHQDREPSTTKHLSDNKVDETAVDDQKMASDMHGLQQEIETSSNRNLVDDPKDVEIKSQEENMSIDKTTSTSSVEPSNSENSINGVPVILKEDKEKGISVNDTTSDIDVRGHEEEHSTNNSLSNSENATNSLTGELDIQKEEQEKGNTVNDTTIGSTASDTDEKGNSVNDTTIHSTASDTDKKGNSVNDTTINSTASDTDEKGNSVNDTTINSTASDADEKGNSVNDTTINSTASNTDEKKHILQEEHQDREPSTTKHLSDNETAADNLVNDEKDMEIKSQEENISTDNTTSSSSVGPSNSENSTDGLTGEPDMHKEEQEKGNSVNDTTVSSTASDIDIRGQEDEHSENLINTVTGEPDAQKEEQKKGNSTLSDIDIKGQDNNNSLSSSENSINNVTDKPDIRKEDHEKDNSINDTTLSSISKEGEIMDDMKDKEDQEHSSETVKVNHQSTEKMEVKESKDVTHVTSSSEETGDKKTEPIKDTTSSNKEKGLVVYGTQEPIMESRIGKPSVLTKFEKLKNLYTASNVFNRLSKKTNLQNEKNKNIKDVNSDENQNQQANQSQKDEGKKKRLESMESMAIKGRVVLYTKLWCQDCKEARLFLQNKRLRYSEINIDVYPGRQLELEKMSGSSDVPKVFFNQFLIGGLKEIKGLDESGKLQEKIDLLTSQGPSPKGPLPPFSGEDDVCSKGIVDELAVIVKKMKESIVVKDRFYKFRRVTNSFMGSEAVDFLSEDQVLEREEAIEFARKLAKELFFRHVFEENTFEDGNHLYRFLDQDPVISQCQNIPRGIIQSKRQPLVELSHRLRFLLYAILEAYISEDGRHVSYRTIHGSEEFARFLRIVEELQRVDLSKTPKEERLAFFINLYNLMAIHAILVWGHPEGALDRRKLFNEFKYVIGGCAYSLSDIYNGILRANQRPPYTLIKPFGINDKRFKVSLPYPEALVHFALVSGNQSAPPLRCYSPKNIDVELREAAHDFLQSGGAFVLNSDSKTVSLTKILKWYSVDFGKNQVEVLKHAANYLEIEKTRTLLELLDSSQLKVVYQPYDWRLNS